MNAEEEAETREDFEILESRIFQNKCEKQSIFLYNKNKQ